MPPKGTLTQLIHLVGELFFESFVKKLKGNTCHKNLTYIPLKKSSFTNNPLRSKVHPYRNMKP
jgi:hypothetical protein